MDKIALDLDNTISASKQSIEFFETLTHLLIAEYKIYIITNREPNTEQVIANELDYLGIEYSEIVITADKAGYIKENNINIFFENEDEYFVELGEETTVFKIREDGNFSFSEKKWIGSEKTVKVI
jgi:3D (Asp-Asp-Asp) domain-containing protein